MPYLYVSNVNALDRFERFDFLLDNGSIATLRKGFSYDLTSLERARASRYIVLTDASVVDQPVPDTPSAGSGNVIVTLPGDDDPSTSYVDRTLWAEVYEL